MKLDKFLQGASSATLLFAASILLTGCGGNTKEDVAAPTGTPKKVVQQVPDGTRVVSTKQYLPTDSFDKEGVKLPYARAINPYTLSTDIIEKPSIDMYISARRAFKAKQYDKAESVLNKLVQQDKTLSGPWVLLGDVSRLKKMPVKAEKLYQKAIVINKANVNAYLRLALVLREQGEFVRSQNTYAEVLSIWKDFPEAHLNLAILYDLYMNKPLLAQQHMEAYQFLNSKKSSKVAEWLTEIRRRTGVSYSIEAGKSGSKPLSVAEGKKNEQ